LDEKFNREGYMQGWILSRSRSCSCISPCI